MEKRDRRYIIAGGAFLAAAAVLRLLAKQLPGFADWYAHGIYKGIVRVYGFLFAWLPCSVVELGLYALILTAVIYIGRNMGRWLAVLSRGVFLAGLLLFVYMANCGVNYYATAFSSYGGLEPETYTVKELTVLCRNLAEQINLLAPGEEDPDYSYQNNKKQWRQEAKMAMQAAGEQFPVLGGYYPEPKEVAVSWILSVQQLCGVYSPFTVEANYNGDMPDYNVPHTMCHELSHLKGFMREDEANFIGYLACISSAEPAFRYSGYLTGWVYAGNELASVDPEAYWELAGSLCERARQDLKANNAFWNQYEGKVAETANQWNDVYLKMNGQADGVRSYGRMVDLMLAYELGR